MAGAAFLLALAVWDLKALAKPPRPAAAGKGTFEYGARVQKPQSFLERRSFMHGGALDLRKHSVAMRYLVERYGNIDDEATTKWNAQTSHSQAKTVHFMGLPISIHAKIAPALAAVEKRIAKTCTGSSRYTPKAIGGFRTQNTYRGVEFSNHLLGIAIDIDPERNPCCGCVDPWPSNPICKNPGTVYKRTTLPKCWINAFERFGFDWLGHDKLEDTMHFEFLGDPERIKK
ncbi:Hypothetical protein A7982_05433 [Minicystis rosea]|nr:Hypothetical protein A7982_05433 [Minicystis rosea]